MDFYDQFSVLPVVRARNIKILNCFGIIEKRNKMKNYSNILQGKFIFPYQKSFPSKFLYFSLMFFLFFFHFFPLFTFSFIKATENQFV